MWRLSHVFATRLSNLLRSNGLKMECCMSLLFVFVFGLGVYQHSLLSWFQFCLLRFVVSDSQRAALMRNDVNMHISLIHLAVV